MCETRRALQLHLYFLSIVLKWLPSLGRAIKLFPGAADEKNEIKNGPLISPVENNDVFISLKQSPLLLYF